MRQNLFFQKSSKTTFSKDFQNNFIKMYHFFQILWKHYQTGSTEFEVDKVPLELFLLVVDEIVGDLTAGRDFWFLPPQRDESAG